MTATSRKTVRQADAIDLLIRDHRAVQMLFKEFAALSDRSRASKKEIADQICAELTIHTLIEENIFYPAIREAIDDDDLIDEAIVEHASAKALIAEIRQIDPGDDLYDAKIAVLSEQIDHHIDEEEREMFPRVRNSKLDFAALAEDLIEAKEDAIEGVTA